MRIPGLRLGILFFCLSTPAWAGSPLLRELIDEANWPAVLVESQRVLAADPADETARLGLALARPGSGSAADTLADLAASARAPEIRAAAAYELGVRAQVGGNLTNAWRYLRIAFLSGGSEPITLKSAWRMDALRSHVPLTAVDAPLVLQIRTVADNAGRSTRRQCQAEDRTIRPRDSVFTWPAQCIVSFYRSAVAPALGSRCSLSPSCSAYFLEAGRTHGLLAFPMIADRLVREPSVVAAAAQPVPYGNTVRYADPVAAHDYWW